METVRLFTRGQEIPVKFSTFPAGEEYVKLLDLNYFNMNIFFTVIITAADSKTIMKAIMLADAIKQVNPNAMVSLKADYLPYGRQDRVCDSGESFSLKVFEELVRTRFDKILSYDVHSEVSERIIDVPNTLPLNEMFYSIRGKYCIHLRDLVSADIDYPVDVVVAPDQGSLRRANEVSKFLGINKVENLLKHRKKDRIVIEKYTRTDFKDYKTALIYDDICDGGGTFIEAAKVIKESNPDIKLYLAVSHAIFSKGVDVLLEWYDNIFTPHDNFNAKWIEK